MLVFPDKLFRGEMCLDGGYSNTECKSSFNFALTSK